jgi:glycosyltransferase involved in cell wall biosynthesis
VSDVAVIVPCHDDGTVVAEAVTSVYAQGEVELVVVDDRSTDPATLGLLEDLAARGTRVLHCDPGGGPGAARSEGLAATSRPLVYVLDADDVLVPGALDAMTATLVAAPEAGFTWGDYEVFGDLSGRYRSPARFLPWTLTYVNPYPVCSMFRRSALEQVGGWQLASGYEDWDLWLALAEQGIGGVRTPGVVYRRRLHGTAGRLAQDRAQHRRLYEQLRARHAQLFGRRRELLLAERPAAWKRLVYPALFGSRALLPLRLEALMQRTMLRRGGGLPS